MVGDLDLLVRSEVVVGVKVVVGAAAGLTAAVLGARLPGAPTPGLGTGGGPIVVGVHGARLTALWCHTATDTRGLVSSWITLSSTAQAVHMG